MPDSDTTSVVAAVVAVASLAGHWLMLALKGGRKMAEERSETLRQANAYTDDLRRHDAAERDKIWSKVERIEERAEADRLVMTELKSDVRHIRATVDRIAAGLDNRGSD